MILRNFQHACGLFATGARLCPARLDRPQQPAAAGLRPSRAPQLRSNAAFTLVEVMICVVLGAMIMAVIVYLTMFASRSFCALANYQALDNQSRNVIDTVCRDLREASAVTGQATNGSVISLSLTNTPLGIGYTLSWDTNAQTFSYMNTAMGSQIYLSGCDQWNVALFQRTPNITATNISYYPATNLSGTMTYSLCKLVDMSWHCYATILGAKVNTESIQTAQIVLRNKQ